VKKRVFFIVFVRGSFGCPGQKGGKKNFPKGNETKNNRPNLKARLLLGGRKDRLLVCKKIAR